MHLNEIQWHIPLLQKDQKKKYFSIKFSKIGSQRKNGVTYKI